MDFTEKMLYLGSAIPTQGSGTGAVDSVNGLTGAVIVTKDLIGLGKADNTSDLNKPISDATQVALNTKINNNAVYNKTESDNLLNLKANNNAVYNKLESDNLLNEKQDLLIAGANIQIIDKVISAQVDITNTNATARLYISGAGVLSENLPTTNIVTPVVLSNSTATTVNFTYTLPENIIISPLSLYATTLFFSNLSGGRIYTIKCEYWVGAKKISDGEAILTPAQDGISSITVMMNTNYLTNNLPLNTGNVLQLRVIISKNNSGNQTINITSSSNLLSAFIRNGGEITANQVYDIYNNELTTQAIINYTKQNITDNSLLTTNKTIVGAINELYNLLQP